MTRPPDVLWPAVHEERRALIEDLASLPTPRWQTPSLCAGWDVHQVLAHLLDSAKTTRLGFVARLAAARFDFDRDNATGVTRERADDPATTLDAFRSVALRTSTPPAPRATRLVEIFVHGEDIRRPLDIRRDYPIRPVITALRHQLATTVKMGGGRERARGWRLVASDAEFTEGAGPEVRGPAVALLLAISGRQVDPTELTGPGVAAFTGHPE